MLKKLSEIYKGFRSFKSPIKHDIEAYMETVQRINAIELKGLNNVQLKAMSAVIRDRAKKGEDLDSIMIDAYALVKEAAARTIGQTPFDVQIAAGICMHKGNLAEMQTGEGKTLTAVMPAYLNALTGKGVHILTFNDYLAHRDAVWMGEIFRFLGFSVGCIEDGMGIKERRKAYACDITYVTAREAGFDYLRDFLCMKAEDLVHRPFNYAIVDEADSILIDEARIPLVIAASTPETEKNISGLTRVIKDLRPGVDYDTDQYGSNAYFTDAGLAHLERILGCSNLYMHKNLELLTDLNCALYAEVLLKKDRDYIVRNGKIEIVDEFNGRVADNRHWPDKLHMAVAAKEALQPEARGMIMDSITLQHFISLYPRISGMTGTAETAAPEFWDLYCMEIVVIPTNKPCRRIDHPMAVFIDKRTKQHAIIDEIIRVNRKGQPILIGTGSVEESEILAADLKLAGIACQVLNARNDEMEAAIIARAGETGAVTVSTNMAGRGVDIRLGGEKEQERTAVAALGGLYVLGTGLNESRRIDNQLKGRAGRQGDPGETKFFISLEDDLVQRYGIRDCLSKKIDDGSTQENGLIDSMTLAREIDIGQKIIEGYNSDMRLQLAKYSFLTEQQRRIIHKMRQDILTGKSHPELLKSKSADKYKRLASRYGQGFVLEIEKKLTLFYINKYWADHLDYLSYMMEGIHLTAIANKNPLHEFFKIAVAAFDEMLDSMYNSIVTAFDEADINETGLDMKKEGLNTPSSTWTYLINDSKEQFGNKEFLIKAISNYAAKPLFTFRALFRRLLKQV